MGRRSGSDGLRSLYDEFVGADPELVNHYERALATLEIGVAINRMRTEAGLTMKELAERVGTQPSAIARLERADYEGHSLGMLRKVAAALGRRVEVRFPRVEVKGPSSSKAPATPGASNGLAGSTQAATGTAESNAANAAARRPKGRK